MLNDVRLIFNFILSQFTNIANLYLTIGILGASIGLWILGRLINIIRRIIP